MLNVISSKESYVYVRYICKGDLHIKNRLCYSCADVDPKEGILYDRLRLVNHRPRQT